MCTGLELIALGGLTVSVAAAGGSAVQESKAADFSADQARLEKKRTGFAKLQEDRKILRETNRTRQAGIQAAANAGVSTESSAVQGGAAAAQQAGNVGLSANAANFGFFSKIQDKEFEKANALGSAATFAGASSIFGSFSTFASNRATQAARTKPVA